MITGARGGQIWRGSVPEPWFGDFSRCGAEFIGGARVIDASASEKFITVESASSFQLAYSKLILATGARELFLPFPGWTLPHVFGVGGLQALAKSGLSVAGKRVIVAGSGPLLLAVAAYLQKHGARAPLIAEQASWKSLCRFSGALLRHPAKLRQALDIKKSILGTRYLTSCWITRASGSERVEEVTILHQGKHIKERCDYLAVAYGFVPSTELAQLLGCSLRGAFVEVDPYQQTSLPHVLCAGEPTGLGGVDESLLEGEVAGYAASKRFKRVNRASTTHFSQELNRAFSLRKELRDLVTGDTIICRCEDVPYKKVRQAHSWREAKLHFRCGMGPCQGRICGPAVQYLFGWKPESVRPPIFPTQLENLIMKEEISQS